MFGFGPDDDDPEARLVWATCGGIRVASAYVPNGRTLDDDHYQYKLRVARPAARRCSTPRAPADGQLVVAGDFNIAPTDDDVYDPAKFTDTTHTSPAERAAARRAGGLGPGRHVPAAAARAQALQLVGLPGRATSTSTGHADRPGARHRVRGRRAPPSPPSTANARKGEKPSDHAPVIIDLAD